MYWDHYWRRWRGGESGNETLTEEARKQILAFWFSQVHAAIRLQANLVGGHYILIRNPTGLHGWNICYQHCYSIDYLQKSVEPSWIESYVPQTHN